MKEEFLSTVHFSLQPSEILEKKAKKRKEKKIKKMKKDQEKFQTDLLEMSFSSIQKNQQNK
jgi:hypothetical protein